MTLAHWDLKKIKCPKCGKSSPSKRWLQVWATKKKDRMALKCPACKKLSKPEFWRDQR